MPVLNARQVIFAQEIVKGSIGRDAYKAAGYRTTNNNATDVCASQLLRNPKVAAYIRELQGRAADRTEISVAYFTEKILALAKAAEDSGNSPAAIQAARAAYMDAAKLNGLIIEKQETRTVRAEDMTDDELAAIARGSSRPADPTQVH